MSVHSQSNQDTISGSAQRLRVPRLPKKSAHAAADVATTTTAVMTALDARHAALDSVDRGSDALSGKSSFRATALSALSPLLLLLVSA